MIIIDGIAITSTTTDNSDERDALKMVKNSKIYIKCTSIDFRFLPFIP